MADVSFPLAFTAGILSFLSPCVLPLFPSYLSFITGISFQDLKEGGHDKTVLVVTMVNALFFIAGFSSIFLALGASSSVLGQLFLSHQKTIRIGGGVLVIIFGLFISGVLKLRFLSGEKKIHLSGKPAGYLGTFLVGITFAAGWTPCIGPILGTILLYAGSKGSAVYGLKLLAVYSLGLAVPFFASAVAFNSFLTQFKKIYRYMPLLMAVNGAILIIFGILLLTDNMKFLNSLFPNLEIKL